jgi:hypothetical protein
MKSTFTQLSEMDKKLFIAKIIHNINYSQSSYETMEAMVKMWDEYPKRQATFFTQSNQLKYGTASN